MTSLKRKCVHRSGELSLGNGGDCLLPPLRGCQSLEATGPISPLGDKDRSK